MKQKLKETIILTAAYYNRDIKGEIVQMMAADLDDLDPGKCIAAYTQWRRNPANRAFPLPAQIRELVNPEEFISPEAQAREIAARIVGAITKFGWPNGAAAENYIGPVGWQAVQRAGGWNYLCQNVGVTLNPLTLQAQMRDGIEGTLRYGSSSMNKALQQGERPKEQTGLESASEVIKRIAITTRPQGQGANE